MPEGKAHPSEDFKGPGVSEQTFRCPGYISEIGREDVDTEVGPRTLVC